MEKKLVLLLLMATLLAGGAFAQISMSVGGGGTFTADFMSYAWSEDGKKWMDAAKQDLDLYNQNIIGGGFFAFF